MTDEKSNRVKGRLKLSNAKLNTILDITKAINNNSSREELFSFLNIVLTKELNIGKFAFFTHEDFWKVSLQQGLSQKDISDINIYSIVNQYETIDVIHNAKEIGTNQFDIVIPVLHKNEPYAYFLLADLNGEKLEISPIIKNLIFIQTLANIIVVAIENKRLHLEELKQLAIKKELEMAQGMQSLLFPKELPNNNQLKVEAFYLPHSEVGGDYYDVIKLSESKTAICIADVSGKGMSAAILMANFQANIRAQLEYTHDLIELVRKTNKKVIESVQYEKFITFFLAIYDATTNRLSYLNAGHQPAILLTSNGNKLLKKGCTVLGMFDELPSIETETITVLPQDKILCFTDGLSELENKEGIQIEVEGIASTINKSDDITITKEKLIKLMYKLEANSGLNDDITFLAAEFL